MDALHLLESACKSVRSVKRGVGAYLGEVREAWVGVLDDVAEQARQHLLAVEEAEEVLEPREPKYGMTCRVCDGDIAECECWDDHDEPLLEYKFCPNRCGHWAAFHGTRGCLMELSSIELCGCTWSPVPASPSGAPTAGPPERCHDRKPNDAPNTATFCDELVGHNYDHRHGSFEFWPNLSPNAYAPTPNSPAAEVSADSPDPAPSAAGTTDPSRKTHGRVRGEGSPADSDIPPSPAGERPNPGDFAAVAVKEVLAAYVPSVDSSGVYCDGLDGLIHARFDDWFDWREHVATEIARRINAAAADRRVADRLDAAGFEATEVFPQHKK